MKLKEPIFTTNIHKDVFKSIVNFDWLVFESLEHCKTQKESEEQVANIALSKLRNLFDDDKSGKYVIMEMMMYIIMEIKREMDHVLDLMFHVLKDLNILMSY